MDIDFQEQLSAVDRTVSSPERDARPARAVTLARSYTATAENLWDALTDAGSLRRWFLPVSGRLEPGGRYQLEGNAGGLITTCEPPSRLDLTWEFGGDVSWVAVRLRRDAADGARLALTHTSHLSEHWDVYGPGAVGVGWEMALMGLAIHLAQPAAPRIDEAAFAVSPEGRAFITGSSEAWGQAAIATGTDPEAAGAATRRTTAFYTGDSAEPA